MQVAIPPKSVALLPTACLTFGTFLGEMSFSLMGKEYRFSGVQYSVEIGYEIGPFKATLNMTSIQAPV